jgi:hypothetical protein
MNFSSLSFKLRFSSAVANNWTKYLSTNVVGDGTIQFGLIFE